MNKKLIKDIVENLSDDLLKPEYRNLKDKNKYTGHCYVASEVYYHLSGEKLKSCNIKHEDSSHWYLVNDKSEIIDITVGQFKTTPNYSKGRVCSFLTKKPSKRAEILIDRIKKSEVKIPDKYKVKSIDKSQSYEWLMYKHYAKCIPSIKYTFGLYDDKNVLQGVCTYGPPANNHNNNLGDYKMIELNRYVTNDNLERNVTSYFIGKTLKMLPKPLSLISYSDIGKNHHGYIYQATNWIYTGKGGGVDFYLSEDGKEIHSRIMSDYRIKHPNMSRDEIAEMLRWKK